MNKKKLEDVTFAPQFMANVSLPYLIRESERHSKLSYHRENGSIALDLSAPKEFGLPYGSSCRMLLFQITKEAVLSKNPCIILGNSCNDFMIKLRGNNGGATLKRTMRQLMQVLACNICLTWRLPDENRLNQIPVASEIRVFNSNAIEKGGDGKIYVTLSDELMNYLEERKPIRLDMKILRKLSRSAQTIDIYVWLTYRLYKAGSEEVRLSWDNVRKQFGSEQTKERRLRNKFESSLKEVQKVYPEFEFETDKRSVLIRCKRSALIRCKTISDAF